MSKPLTFRPLLLAYQARYRNEPGTHDALSSAMGALLADGEVFRAGRTGRRVLYGDRGSTPDKADRAPDLERAVAEIVARHYRREKVPIATAAIGRELRRLGLWPDRFSRLTALLEQMQRSAGGESSSRTGHLLSVIE